MEPPQGLGTRFEINVLCTKAKAKGAPYHPNLRHLVLKFLLKMEFMKSLWLYIFLEIFPENIKQVLIQPLKRILSIYLLDISSSR